VQSQSPAFSWEESNRVVTEPHFEFVPVGDPGQLSPTGPGPVAIDDTTEIRWFLDGPLPSEVGAWFTGRELPGHVERRTDSYRLGHRGDTGVKRRFGRMLELKSRLGARTTLALDAGLTGRVETWRRWSPADGRVTPGTDQAWIDVHKTVVKRRFDADGNERPVTGPTWAPIVVACDVEIATVEVCGRHAWSLALAATGPDTSRQASILTSWAALGPGRPSLLESHLRLQDSCGYPEWLIRTTTPHHRASQIEATTPSHDPACSRGDRSI
jgi:hypothetical protein